MQIKRTIVCSLAALAFSLALSHDAGAQYRDRNHAPQVSPEDTEPEIDRKRPSRGDRPDVRKERPDKRAPRTRARPKDQPRRAAPEDNRRPQAQPRDQRRRARPERDKSKTAKPRDQRRRARTERDKSKSAQPRDQRPRARPKSDRRGQAQVQHERRRARPKIDKRREARPPRRRYDRPAERRWHRDRPRTRKGIYVPRRWKHRKRPHHRRLWKRRYGRVWWCGTHCRIGHLFGFSVWAVHTVVSYDSPHSFPVWEALEYNRTGETSLWESGWGYVEFTPTRTFTMRFGRRVRDCRDFLRVVVRQDGLQRRYRGTACRNPRGEWWIV
jgi:hypothetical protein